MKRQEKGPSDRLLWRTDRYTVLACAFTQYLLKACCLPEVVPGAGNSNEESDQGFFCVSQVLRRGKRRIDAFRAPVSKAEGHVGLAVLRGVAAHVEPLLQGHRAARAALVLAGPSPAGRPPRAQPTRGFQHVRWAPTLTSARSFHLRPRPRAALRAGATVAEPRPRSCCSPIAPHRALAVRLGPTLPVQGVPTPGGGAGCSDLGARELLGSGERSRRPHPAWGGETGVRRTRGWLA